MDLRGASLEVIVEVAVAATAAAILEDIVVASVSVGLTGTIMDNVRLECKCFGSCHIFLTLGIGNLYLYKRLPLIININSSVHNGCSLPKKEGC